MMSKGKIVETYKTMSADDQRAFRAWLWANGVIASLFAGVLVAMALASSNLSGPDRAMAKGAHTTGIRAATPTTGRDNLSPYERMIRIAPNELPTEQVEWPF
jgi:hypothetical protein